MKLPAFVLGAVLIAALPLQSGEGTPPPSSTPAAVGSTAPIRPSAPEPPSSNLDVGDRAPDFSYQAADYSTVTLKQLLAQGHLLMVFGANDEVLNGLERERDALLDLGVVPVAIVNARSSSVWSTAKRLNLHYTMVPDPRRVIATQFNVVNTVDASIMPAWFVVDRVGRVRALRRNELPISGFPRLAATVLAIPSKDVTLPVRSR